MRKIIISIVADKDSSRYGKLAVHVEEDGLESEAWYPGFNRKFELSEALLNELTIRSEEFRDPMVNRTIADLEIIKQEL
jgi:hypothetical protein